jgi:hypothetical protein
VLHLIYEGCLVVKLDSEPLMSESVVCRAGATEPHHQLCALDPPKPILRWLRRLTI